MHVADVREDMVLNLVIESTHEERYQPVFASEIGGGGQLVDGPGIFHIPAFVRYRVVRAFDHVRQLEHQCQDYPSRVVHYEEANQDFPPSHVQHDDGQYHPNGQVQDFGDDENRPLLGRVYFFVKRNAPADVAFHLLVVLADGPTDGHQAIEQHAVVVLKFVKALPILLLVEAQEATGINVLIHAVDVGISMVKHVVLYFPVVHIARQDVDGTAHEVVYPLVAGVGAMVAVVHHAHAHEGHAHAQYDGEKQHRPLVEIVGDDKEIRRQEDAEHDRRLDVQLPIAVLADVVLLKIGVHTAVQRFEKIRAVRSRKLDC